MLLSLADVVLRGGTTKQSLKLISDFYSVDLDLLESECKLFHNLTCNNKKMTAVECKKFLISNGLDKTLPHFVKAAKRLATIPAMSCSAERSFSGLRQLKTYLRSTVGQTRLSNLALLYLER